MYVGEVDTKAVYDATLQLMMGINDYFVKGESVANEIIFVPISIVSRILKTHDAITLLLKNGHYSEAAILVLTQFELRFDLLFVSSDIKYATAWVEHENPKALNMGMKAKLQKLLKRDAVRLYETFGYLSGIKHGNPLYSELAFPGRSRAGRFMISTGPIEDRFARTFSEALHAYSIYQVAWSAQVLSKLISKYAVMDHERRVRVHENYMGLKYLESDFRRFLKRKVTARKTFFGIKSRITRSKQRPAADASKKGQSAQKASETIIKKATTMMKQSSSKEGRESGTSPSQLIDARIKKLADWRGATLARVRALIKQADPDIVEEVKWRKPSNAMLGVPVWEHAGIICTGETYKNYVKLTFAKGASLEDPSGLFNASLEGGTRRAIDIREDDTIDEEAFNALIRAAVTLNISPAK